MDQRMAGGDDRTRRVIRLKLVKVIVYFLLSGAKGKPDLHCFSLYRFTGNLRTIHNHISHKVTMRHNSSIIHHNIRTYSGSNLGGDTSFLPHREVVGGFGYPKLRSIGVSNTSLDT